MSDINIEGNAEILGGTDFPIQIETEISAIDEKIKDVGEEQFFREGLYHQKPCAPIFLYVPPKTQMEVARIFVKNIFLSDGQYKIQSQAKKSEANDSDIEDDVDFEEELMYLLIAFQLNPSKDYFGTINDCKKEMSPEEILEVEQKVESWVKLHPIELEG